MAIGMVVGHILIGVAVVSTALLVAPAILGGPDPQDWSFPVQVALDCAAKFVVLVGGLAVCRALRGRTAGGDPTPPRRAASAGALAGIAFMPLMLGIATAQNWVYGLLDRKVEVQDLVLRGLRDDWTTFALVAFAAVVMAPAFEEVVFRRFLYGGLRAGLGSASSAVASAVLFSLWHQQPDVFPVTFALGLALAALRERTGGLTAPIAMHACYNAVQMAGILTARLGTSGG